MTKNEEHNGNLFVLSHRSAEEINEDGKSGADFETAVSATGFGKFNIILLLIAVPTGWSSIFEATTMSYVFPAAQCDLQLTLENKGFLNAITYIGMISSGFVWGFLCDTLGRRKLLAIGLLLDGIFVIMSASSQSFALLVVGKFLGGFIINGPFSALTTYLSEFHCAKHRARIQMTLGIVFSMGSVALPLFAWAILPLDLNVTFFGGAIEFHSWNFYLLLCSLPALLSSVAYIFMPESPKFLMTVGRNQEALDVFRRVYSMNSGKHPDTFPIKVLVEETKDSSYGGKVTANRNKKQALKEGWQQLKPLFFPPQLPKIVLICTMQFLIMMSLNTLRLWLPQIFQAINDYEFVHNGTSTDLCTMIELIRPVSVSNATEECTVNLNNSSVYIKSIIVGLFTIVGYIGAGILINALGKKRLLNILGILSGVSAMGLYFAQDSLSSLILSTLFISLASININVVLAVVVDLFPTTLRTMTVALTMMVGRSGAMMGNLVFPLLLEMGCAPPFFSIGAVIIGCGFLSCLLPNTDMKALQ